jgi:hyperosmotically inducible periplasmic protein
MKAANFLRTGCLSVAILGTALSGASMAQEPDNTGANKDNTTSADQQKNNPADRDLAKKIRQSIMDDKNLSTYAHNVKVIVRNGEVTLKGPVKSDDEKASVESKATELAGAGKVQNQLTVKSGGAY